MAGAAEREKRKTFRIQPFVAPCRVIDGGRRLAGYLTDISTRGARISCDEAVSALAQSIVIEVRFSRRPAASRLPARIRWRRPGGKPKEAQVLGVTFDGAAAQERAALESVVEEFQRRAALLG